jgi:hypothetical protein
MVSRTVDTIDPRGTPSVSLQAADRWMFVFMAALFVVTVLVGFVPDSFARAAAIQAGQRPQFHPMTHVHAVLMGAWLLLLLAQSALVASNRRVLHQRLGLVSLALVPAMVVAGIVLVPAVFREAWTFVTTPPPGVDAAVIAETKALVSNIALPQIRVGVLFPILVGWALWVRRTDPDTHKRLMILATALPLPAAMDRIEWLPTSLPTSFASGDLYMLLWVAPMFLYDVIRRGRVQRAYAIWFLLGLPPTIAVHWLWGSPWWLATVPRLMGAEP